MLDTKLAYKDVQLSSHVISDHCMKGLVKLMILITHIFIFHLNLGCQCSMNHSRQWTCFSTYQLQLLLSQHQRRQCLKCSKRRNRIAALKLGNYGSCTHCDIQKNPKAYIAWNYRLRYIHAVPKEYFKTITSM